MDWRKYINRIDIRRSLTRKICFWTLLIAAAIFAMVFGVGAWFATQKMLKEGHQKANLELDKSILYIEKELELIEASAQNVAFQFPKDYLPSKEIIVYMCRRYLECNPNVQGIAFAFEPECYPDVKGGYSPYLMRSGDSLRYAMLSEKYNYYDREWYAETKRQAKPRWSNPFHEVHGSVICSYCVPLYNGQGKLLGVLAVDMGLKGLTEKIEKIRPYPSSQLTVMDRNLVFIVHPNRDYILRESAMSLVEKSKGMYVPNESVMVKMKHKERGFDSFYYKDREKYLYYSPIHQSEWTVALECDADEIKADMKTIKGEMWFNTTIGLLIMLIVIGLLMRSLLRPLWRFSAAAKKIALGNFDVSLPEVKDRNELWHLRRSMNYMQEHLKQYVGELTHTMEEKGKIESELRIAHGIQMAMLPKIFPPYPERTDMHIYGTLISAKDVGGDLYDFFIRDEKLFFCIGDVSGKGIPASLVMAVTRSLLRMVAAKEDHAVGIVQALNESMADMNSENMFVTMFVGVLNLKTGEVEYCNAGHNAPYILGAEGVRPLEVEPNLPVAIEPNMTYRSQHTYLKKGESIFLYTDGLTEAENKAHDLFGEERLKQELERVKETLPDEQLKSLLDSVHRHADGAEQSDDLTMLSIQYLGEGQKPSHEVVRHALTLSNNIRQVPLLGTFVDDIAREAGVSEEGTTQLNLAMEEAVVNVMNYAYPEGVVGKINLTAMYDGNDLTFCIVDYGKPFDPTQAEDIDTTKPLEERGIGGLGIFLVRQLMDELTYERKNGENRLTLVKHLTSKG